MDLTILIPLAVFVSVTAVVILVRERLSNGERRIDQRFDELQNPDGSPSDGIRGISRVSSAISTLVEKASPQLAKPLTPSNAHEVTQLRQRLSYAGLRSDLAPSVFLSAKVACLALGFFLGGGTLIFTGDHSPQAIARLVLFAGGGLLLPDLVLRFLTKRRHEQLFFGLPDAIDLMVVCIEAGLGLDQAMRKVSEEMRKTYPVVAYEFELSTMHQQMGMNRIQVFRDLGQRNGEDDLRSLAAVMIHASRFGTGIGLALRNHGDAMRIRRRQMAEERASKSAVKLIFPLVLFIFPAIFVVLIGPAAINIVRFLMPVMNGG